MTGIERLNACFLEFPEQTKELLHHMIRCPEGMERHVMHRELPDGSKWVTTTGLLNGTLFRRGHRLAYAVEASDYGSREEELADIKGYALIPSDKFKEVAPDGSGSRLQAPEIAHPDDFGPGIMHAETLASRRKQCLSFEQALPFVRDHKRIARMGWNGEFYVEFMRGEVTLIDRAHGLPAVWMGVWSDMLALDWEVVS